MYHDTYCIIDQEQYTALLFYVGGVALDDRSVGLQDGECWVIWWGVWSYMMGSVG